MIPPDSATARRHEAATRPDGVLGSGCAAPSVAVVIQSPCASPCVRDRRRLRANL